MECNRGHRIGRFSSIFLGGPHVQACFFYGEVPGSGSDMTRGYSCTPRIVEYPGKGGESAMTHGQMEYDYKVLGIEPDCTDTELRTTWKRLILRHHPDRHEDDAAKAEAHHRFAQLSGAYESIRHQRSAARPRSPKAPDVCVEVMATLGDAYVGRKITVKLPLRRICKACRAGDMLACDACDGEGSFVVLGAEAVHKDCSQCAGVGRVRSDSAPRCRPCHDVGIVTRTEEIQLEVPKGAMGPCEVRVEGQGEDSLTCGARGDLLAFIQIPRTGQGFVRYGPDLLYRVRITMEEALEGGPLEFRHLDGSTILVPRVQGVVRPQTLRVLDRLGMGGDLVVSYDIEWPRQIDQTTKGKLTSVLRQWRKRERETVRQNPGDVKVPPRKKQKE